MRPPLVYELIVSLMLIAGIALVWIMLFGGHARGLDCPTGWYLSGGGCAPLSPDPRALPILPRPRRDSSSCPTGYYLSGDFCVALNPDGRIK